MRIGRRDHRSSVERGDSLYALDAEPKRTFILHPKVRTPDFFARTLESKLYVCERAACPGVQRQTFAGHRVKEKHRLAADGNKLRAGLLDQLSEICFCLAHFSSTTRLQGCCE